MLLLQYNIINLKCITVVALTTFILPKFYINNIIIIIINVTDLILYHSFYSLKSIYIIYLISYTPI